MIGTAVSHYRILEKAGEGGMGVVYKAEDTKLKRTVALKFLPPELTKDPQAKARFIQEAQAAAALDHSNICAVFEIGETEGTTYIAMSFVKGQSLKEKIAAGPLSIGGALDIAGQVAEGLKEAHERGIIHSDIKPANIMLTEKGQAKIMDFGLAKLTSAADVTRTLTVMGTIAYMSPEQAKGEAVDHQTDIWSLGATLYEMLTGQMPFGRKHDQALIYSILNDRPQPVSRLRPEIPIHLERVVQKAMEKDRLSRYQSMDEVLKDLKTARAPEIILPKLEKSIVVLPFENISPDPEQEYFSDGLTEEIISDLSNVHSLCVISRSSAMTFKGTNKTIPEIARQLNVQYVLEGSVRKSGNNLRITAQLIDAQTDVHLWAEKYSGTMDDVFEIQEKVSRSIVEALKLKLTPKEKQKLAARPIEDVKAYECYLKARTELFKMSREAINRAIQYLQNAIDIKGDNAFLYSGMAWAYWWLVNIGVEQEEYLVKAEEFARKALTVDPESVQAHAMLGWIAVWNNTRQAIYHLKKALSVSADDTLALQGLAMVYVQWAGKVGAAIPLCERLVQVDPLDLPTKWFQGGIYFYDGRYDLALPPWRRLYDESPENPVVQFYYALTEASLGHMDDVLSIISEGESVIAKDAFSKMALMLRHAILRDRERVFQEMTPDFQKTSQRDAALSHHLAGILALLGEKNQALDWLENAIDRGFINYPLLAEKDPLLATIRDEERFKKLMERVKYEWENFEV